MKLEIDSGSSNSTKHGNPGTESPFRTQTQSCSLGRLEQEQDHLQRFQIQLKQTKSRKRQNQENSTVDLRPFPQTLLTVRVFSSIRPFYVLFWSTDGVLTEIEQGRKEQDDLLNQISAGLDTLKLGAQFMTTELKSQDEILDHTQYQAETTLQETKQTTHHRTFSRYVCRR